MPNYSPYGYNPYNGYMVPNYNQNMVYPMQPPQNFQQNRPVQNAPVGLNGKPIQRPEEITPNDVMMDGSISYFPAQDGSCIYAKSWNQTADIVNQIRPCPVPAYQVANPYAYNNCCNNGCGCNSCC